MTSMSHGLRLSGEGIKACLISLLTDLRREDLGNYLKGFTISEKLVEVNTPLDHCLS